MKLFQINGSGTWLKLGVSALALAGVVAVAGAVDLPGQFVRPAIADTHGDDDGHDDGGGQGGSQGGSGNQGQGQGNQGQGGSGGQGASGGGQGEPDDDSEGRGPRYGAGEAERGGRPVWAQEGIPEIELGRLNVARSPGHVLDRAYDEVLANFNAEMAAFYSLTLDEAIAVLSLDFDNVSFVDSPLQNLSLLRDALDGSSVLNTLPQVSNSNDVLTAMFLGAASDKTVPITPETAFAVATILGFDLTQAEATALASDAEAVRIAILAGHG